MLRIEDTDMARNSEEATKAILEAFDWVGMDYDGEVLYQSRRFELYKKFIQKLLDEKKAYYCYMTKEELDALRNEQIARKERPRYDRRYRDFVGTPPPGIEPVVRIKAPLQGDILFEDGIKGSMAISADELDDFIIARSDGTPTYNFVVVIDDALTGVTDVIRGDDHLSNTPKQILVYEALGFKLPRFYHVPMICNPEGRKLSKRDGAMDVMEYKKQGYLPEALLNFLVRLGWSFGDQEIFSMQEMKELFDPREINPSASSYNATKLLWLNSHYIKNMENEKIARLLEDYGLYLLNHDKREILLDSAKGRSKTLVEMAEQIRLIIEEPKAYDEEAVKKTFKDEESLKIIADFADFLDSWEGVLHLPTDYHGAMEAFLSQRGLKFAKLGQPLRLALVGRLAGPGLDEIMSVIGKEETVLRIKRSQGIFSGKI